MKPITNGIVDDISAGLTFGKQTTDKSFTSFTIKIIALLIPGIIAGNAIDNFVKYLYDKKILGNDELYYIFIQTIISIIFLYILSVLSNYTDEFQNTFAGIYFTGLFFSMQTNYISYLQMYMNGK
jgi:hypothetical protein